MNNITMSNLKINPLLAYSIQTPEPEILSLSEYELGAYPAVFGNLLGFSVEKVKPKYKMGRVLSFDLQPRVFPDPIIIYCPSGDLRPYYKIWSRIMSKGIAFYQINRVMKDYDESIKHFVGSVENILSVHEVVFAMIEMLKFKNDVILNNARGN